MVVFDQLRISDDGRTMYIDIHVSEASYYDNVYLDNVTIMTADKVSEADPTAPTSNYIYKQVFDGNLKEASLALTATDFTRSWETDANAIRFKEADMLRTLFFVYVTCKGTPDECTPCGMDNITTLGVTFDETVFYQNMMNYTKDLIKDCTVPHAFLDFILLWNAFKAAIRTGHYIAAIRFYNMMFGIVGSVNIIKGCGCNG